MFGTIDRAPPKWRCPECVTLPADHVDSLRCICQVTTPTPAIQFMFEPIPTNAPMGMHVQALTVRLGVAKGEAQRSLAEARFQDRYDREHAAELREDAERWELRATRIQEQLRGIQAKRKRPSKAKKSAVAKTRARTVRSRRPPRAKAPRSASRPNGRATTASAKANGPGNNDGPPSGDPAPSPANPVLAPPPRPARSSDPSASPRRSKEERLARTIAVWQPRTTRPLSLEDARQITETATAVVRLLHKWATERSTSSISKDSTRLPVDGTGESSPA